MLPAFSRLLRRNMNKWARSRMALGSRKWFTALALATMAGCRRDGFDLEFHMPVESTTIELTIDMAAGVEPRHVGGRVYAIDLDHDGKATIRSGWPITTYHRTFIVTHQERLRRIHDFEIVDSGWRMNQTTHRTPHSVTSRSHLDGSVFWMEIQRKEPSPAAQIGRGDASR